MEQTLKIGIAVKPQGIRGEIKVRPLTDDPQRFRDLKEVIIDGVTHKVLNARVGGEDVFIALYGVSDRNAAEKFRGKFLLVNREDAVKTGNDRFFIADLIGARVVDECGVTYGVITDITEGKTDVIWLESESGEKSAFPFLKKVLVGVDVAAKTMTVDSARFSEVVCREN